MRTSLKFLLGSAGVLSTLGATSNARAQVDINPPLPNVLLLIDTSGSMENMIDGKTPEASGATCKPGVQATPMNRWATLLSVLTGSIDNFTCQSLDRSSAGFLNEYKLGTANPYDYKYYLPFHRVLSNGCVAGPGTIPTNWWDWPANAIKYHAYGDANTVCPAPGTPGGFNQQPDGILDTFRDRVRFGLMTFDSFPDAGTGVSGTAPNHGTGTDGLWSYFLGWNAGGSPAKGNPPNCGPAKDFEVGARNPAAPPWEGRLMPFGRHDAALSELTTSNDRIQEALLAMRPYGATPLAGMLSDARDFLLSDSSNDPSTGKAFGPKDDPYFAGGCRKTFIIVLSDGEPNLDLRDSCATGDGKCPYEQPYEVTRALATNVNPNKQVLTYTVGFGMSTAGAQDCRLLTSADLTQPGGKCANATGNLKTCCTLGRMAYEGGTTNAFYADDLSQLKSALSTVLADIAKGSTSRTLPVFSNTTATTSGGANLQGNAPAASYQFASSFETPLGGDLWRGNLERKRYKCPDALGKPTLEPVTATKGDDFAANLNSNDSSRPRQFLTYVGTTVSGAIQSTRTLRPNTSLNDGLGAYTGAATNSGNLANPATFVTAMGSAPQAMGISTTSPPPDCAGRLGTSSGSECAKRAMNWMIGENNPGLPETRNPTSCPTGQTCSKLGAIYHSTPVTVGIPRDYLRDESYSAFALLQRERPLMLYTATVDGQLHAFQVASNKTVDTFRVDEPKNNELWSFFPPYVLPRILGTYDQQGILLDGAPVVKDVVFERTQAQADGATAAWNTVLVAGGGAGNSFYYALDITDPTKPKFLWQLSTDDAGNALFGQSTSTPAIATVPLVENSVRKEVAVAILPGGSTNLRSGTCARQITSWPNVDPSKTYMPRGSVRCWGTAGAPNPARSLTIVRLDTGKVLMNFRGAAIDGPPNLTTNKKVGVFDSPVSGIPVPYPAVTGQVSNRVYVGDSDGTLWRVDLSNTNPANWTVNMAWDAYSLSGDTATSGEPIQTPPVVGVDPIGNNVILFSTGDQEQFTASGAIKTRAWSIKDQPKVGKFETKANWYIPFTNGKRVTGPMALFESVAYFATFTPTPSAGNACSDGFGSVWGVDYIKNDGADDKPTARYVTKLGTTATFEDQDPGTVVFGVAVTQTPTCKETQTYSDADFGTRTSVKDAAGGDFQLVFQTGKGGAGDGSGSSTKTTVVDLAPPVQVTRIDSWASVVE
jgi:type IV pilus assembly protein PilY1